MGARGLLVARFRGRYFTSYFFGYRNKHPQALGRAIVNRIPTDPEQYKGTLTIHYFSK
jgi:hypothetical protein